MQRRSIDLHSWYPRSSVDWTVDVTSIPPEPRCVYSRVPGIRRRAGRLPCRRCQTLEFTPRNSDPVPMVAFGKSSSPRARRQLFERPQVATCSQASKILLAAAYRGVRERALLRSPKFAKPAWHWSPTNPSASYDAALAHLTGPKLDPGGNVFWRQRGPILSRIAHSVDRSDLSLRLDLAHLGTRVHTETQTRRANCQSRTFVLRSDAGVIRFHPACISRSRIFQSGLPPFLERRGIHRLRVLYDSAAAHRG